MKVKERKAIIIEMDENEARVIKLVLEIVLEDKKDPVAGVYRKHAQNLIDELTALSF